MKRVMMMGILLCGMQAVAQEETAFGKTAEVEWDLRCFPNPTSDLLIIKSSKEIKQVQFYDLNGSELKAGSMPNNCYSLSDFPDGWIFLRVESTDGTVEKKQVYKQ